MRLKVDAGVRHRRSSRRHRLFAWIGYFFFCFIVIVLGVEGGLRLWHWWRHGAPFLTNNPNIVAGRHQPIEATWDYTHPYLPVTMVPEYVYDEDFRINAAGFRGEEIGQVPLEKGVRIACIGGSSVFCTGIERDSATWPEQLETDLNELGALPQVEAVNAGVPGYMSTESLINLALRVIPLEPDVVIIYMGYNDIKPNRMEGFEPDYAHARRRRGLPKFSAPWYLKIRTVWTIWNRLQEIQGAPVVERLDSGEEKRRWDTVQEAGLEAFHRNLLSMAAVARAHGAKVVFVRHLMNIEGIAENPKKYKKLLQFVPTLTPEGIEEAKTKYDAAYRQAAEKTDAVYVDVSGEVPADEGHFLDHVHMTEKGAEVFARALAEELAPELKDWFGSGDIIGETTGQPSEMPFPATAAVEIPSMTGAAGASEAATVELESGTGGL